MKPEASESACQHKWVHLRKEDPKEVGYRRWKNVDRFYCEKCLDQKTVETDQEERRSHAW